MVFGFFRKSKRSTIREPSINSRTDVQNAVTLQLNTIEQLSQREKILKDRIKECIAKAKEKHANDDKAGALTELRRKKLLEEEVTRVSASIMTLESHTITLEGAEMQQMALSALSTGANVHKRLQEQMETSKVDMLMDQLEEQREAQLEIYDAMTQGLSMPAEFEDELEKLMEEEKTKELALEQELQELAGESFFTAAVQPEETEVQILSQTPQPESQQNSDSLPIAQ